MEAMSQGLVTFLEAFDSATTAPLAATLTGLSLTASSLLANLVKSYSDKLPVLRAEMQNHQTAVGNAKDPTGKAALQVVAKSAESSYQDAVKVTGQATTALRTLLWAFSAFTINLLEALSLDALIEKPIMRATSQSREEILRQASDYLTFLPIDVGISGVSLIVGIALLAYSANRISAVIPKVS